MNVIEVILAFIILIIFSLIYFIPAIFAYKKKHFSGIFVLNLFLGWTFFFWVISLVWAVSDEKEQNESQIQTKKRKKSSK